MSTRRLLVIAISGAAAISLILIFVFAVPFARQTSYDLPDTAPEASPTFGDDNVEGVERVVLTVDNVRDVVASLSRPAAYSRNLMIENFWDGGNAVYNISVSVSGGMTAALILHGGTQETIIIRDGYAHIRYSSHESFAKIPLDTPNAADEYQMIPTYEDIIALDRADIISAELSKTIASEPLIYVRWKSGSLGYITDGYLSVRLGLLIRAETRDGDTVVYRMTAGECDLAEPDASVFDVD